MHRETPQGDRK